MTQVLVNLVSNAIKFTAKSWGEMKVRVSMGASTGRPTSYPPNVVFFNSDAASLRLVKTQQAEWGDAPAVYIMVAVRDTGIGISDEAQKRLFERFNQATPRTESVYGGSGLGLAVSRRLCHLQGGEIGVSSKEGEGSTFGFFFTVRKHDANGANDVVEESSSSSSQTLQMDQICRNIQLLGNEVTDENHQMTSPSIPLDPEVTDVEEINPAHQEDERTEHTNQIAEEITGKIESSVAESELQEKSSQRILLVEDNIINSRILSRKLQKLGFGVTEVTNGREALDAVKHDRFDCILMDQVMPVMDGNTATKAIREFQNARNAVYTPVIGVTANVRSEQYEEMRRSGMDDVVYKPYKMDELVEKIQRLTSRESA
jgi:CheY-like chemotaxis protein